MDYKTILVHVNLSRHAARRYAMAAELAAFSNGHLIGAAATGISPVVVPAEQCGLPGGLLDDYFGAMREQLQAALDHFEAAVAPAGASYSKRMGIEDEGGSLVSLGRFADLIVISRDDPDEALARSDTRLPEFVILNTPRPVMVVPLAQPEAAPAQPALADATCVMVAWNGSRQAAAALVHALPVLRRAREVVVAAFTAENSAASGASGPADLLAYLARHGVAARFEQRAEPLDMGHALLDLARQRGAGLIVMGCYGHSRLREICLGGVSRTLLRSSPIPLLMAHM